MVHRRGSHEARARIAHPLTGEALRPGTSRKLCAGYTEKDTAPPCLPARFAGASARRAGRSAVRLPKISLFAREHKSNGATHLPRERTLNSLRRAGANDRARARTLAPAGETLSLGLERATIHADFSLGFHDWRFLTYFTGRWRSGSAPRWHRGGRGFNPRTVHSALCPGSSTDRAAPF